MVRGIELTQKILQRAVLEKPSPAFLKLFNKQMVGAGEGWGEGKTITSKNNEFYLIGVTR